MRFTAGRDFDDYLADELLRAAVERQLTIIGEALSQLRRIDPDAASGIAAVGPAVGLRNILVHGYASVDHRIVWGVVEGELSRLLETLDQFLP